VSAWPPASAPFGRRLATVARVERLGAYRVLRVAQLDRARPDSAEASHTEPDGADRDRAEPAPGQFAMLAAAERWGGGEDERPHLPRAFSIARVRDRQWHFLVDDVGPGTRRLGELRAGEPVWVLGPLGRGFAPPAEGRRAILVGGGAGIAPLAILQDRLAVTATVLLGFRDLQHAHGAALLDGARIATDDGSSGHRGRVTELLAADLARDAHAVVYACGPAPMLEGVRAICAEGDVPAQLALEAGMACGFGACFGCVVPTRSGYLRVCVDGPVVDAAELEHVDAHAGSPA
jgi:dihydroorotate dehydrogenase electron transfer subunit